ncbi:hypothetical protein NLG97_g6081 [Lecanicillium saksenae]|uniref:Uncharacterized protein n=1 Tax=Lecanicillium saksenae TaxID=468837 RepID=A0ACC1QT11_9HYPO|nr:hypothetical protein NLG97_g6081 [Lecanicillium saksenae]
MGNALSCRSRRPDSRRAGTPPPRMREPVRESVTSKSKMTPPTTVTAVSPTPMQDIDGRTSIFMYGLYHADPLRSHPVQLLRDDRRESLEATSVEEQVSIRDDMKSQKRRGMLLINSAAESSFAASTNSTRLEEEEDGEDTKVELVEVTTTTKKMDEACEAQQISQPGVLPADPEIRQER